MANVLRQSSPEETAKREIGRTDMAPGIAVFLTALFLATLFAVPLLQHFDEVRQFVRGIRPTWVPHCYAIVKALPESGAVFRGRSGGVATRVIAANRNLLRDMRRYENELEESSWLTRVFLPPTQWLLTRWLLVGNEKVYPGERDWLFYRPDVDYVTGPGFLSRRHVESRLKSATEWDDTPQPDPLKAIVAFNDRLRTRGIRLILMPTPVKPTLHPDRLSRAFRNRRAPLHNASYPAFVERLRKAGVAVVDCAPLLAEATRKTGQPQYLAGDTHWRPEAMDQAAELLAAAIRATGLLSSDGTTEYRRETAQVSAVGDLRLLLKFPASRGAPVLETVHIRPVISPDGDLWLPGRNAEILVLGDSFSNIYSLPSMEWGASAGLVEQLSYYLRKPVDRIVRNDAGAYATREALFSETADGRDRLQGKRVVVWQFAARELAFGNWKEEGPPHGIGQPPSAIATRTPLGRLDSAAPL